MRRNIITDLILRTIANHLQEAGIASIRFDFNGCGQSEGRFEDMTVPQRDR